MQGKNDVWLWSDVFTEVIVALIEDPPSDAEAGFDWPRHRQRLTWWREQVEGARELYQRGHTQALQLLYDYWQTIAGDDAQEQAKFARETYRQLYFVAST
jgi:hypothetical protein